jgi:hemerythrin
MFIDPKRIPNTGNPLIDAGHERLAHLANEAYGAWQSGLEAEFWLGLLEDFVAMIDAHFREEEQLVSGLDSNRLEQLRAMHVSLLSQLRESLGQLRQKGPEAAGPVDLFNLIDHLLYEHELGEDQILWDARQLDAPARNARESLIVWDDSFLVGEPHIDQQHQALAEALNHLHDEITQRNDLARIVALLKGARQHIEWHFAYEEKLMAENSLHGRESHRALHQHLLEDLDQVIRDVAQRRYEELEELLENYLKYWLLDHILHVDKALGRELAKKRTDG